MDNTQAILLRRKHMERELQLLRSFVIGMAGRDSEGNYRPEFMRKILKLVNEHPTHTFQDRKSFLRSLDRYVQ